VASLSTRELRKLLEEHGCRKLRDAGSAHELWVSPRNPRPFSVPKNLKGEGTLKKILKDAGIE
jgi:predicted RNA binding protein YcfA (HicA-like mRNA interferase family)